MNDQLLRLYDLADEEGIDVIGFDTACCKSLTIFLTDKYYIAINPMLLDTSAEECECLAHEVGHCMTGTVYDRQTPPMLQEKSERTADIWSFKRLLPKEKILDALKGWYTEAWQLAEYFDLPERFIKKAAQYYGIT